MRYIDADVIIEMLNNKAKTDYEMGLYNHGALTQSFIRFVERQPTADVVPKSEVERLRKALDEYEETSGLKQAKAEVAREIFAEIEKWLVHEYVPYIRGYSNSLARNFAELKKKYT